MRWFYLPTTIAATILLANRAFFTLPDEGLLVGLFKAAQFPLFPLHIQVNALLVFMVEHLPSGPWKIMPNPLISTPNFIGWLITAMIVVGSVFLINYCTVLLARFVTRR